VILSKKPMGHVKKEKAPRSGHLRIETTPGKALEGKEGCERWEYRREGRQMGDIE
jgi:hypothetical protein